MFEYRMTGMHILENTVFGDMAVYTSEIWAGLLGYYAFLGNLK